MRSEPVEQHAGWAEPVGPVAGVIGAAAREAVAFVDQVLTVAEAEVRKLRHDPVELFTRAVQPTLWLVVFGQVMNRLRAIPTGEMAYLDFMAPGILAQSVLFIAIFYGISLYGYLHYGEACQIVRELTYGEGILITIIPSYVDMSPAPLQALPTAAARAVPTASEGSPDAPPPWPPSGRPEGEGGRR